jgi:hypothetical protein
MSCIWYHFETTKNAQSRLPFQNLKQNCNELDMTIQELALGQQQCDTKKEYIELEY